MAKSNIEWTDYTFNPWWGCTKVSPACTHCYAETFANRYGHKVWGDKAERRFFGDKHWNQPVNWHNKAGREQKRFKVFCASMADVFEERDDLMNERERLWHLIEETENLDWLLLTKRPENVLDMVPAHWHDFWPEWCWIGTTVESQEQAEKRIPELLKVPANVRFLSCEPMLGPIDLCAVPQPDNGYFQWRGETGVIGSKNEPDDFVYSCKRGIHWVICGGESGPNARPMHPDWARSLRDQCVEADVPFFFKQWGDWLPCTQDDINDVGVPTCKEKVVGVEGRKECGYYCDERVGHVDHKEHLMKRVGKKNAGRLLDGKEWNQFPEVTHAL